MQTRRSWLSEHFQMKRYHLEPTLIVLIAVSLMSRILVASLRPTFGSEPISWLPNAVPWNDFYSIYGQELIDISRNLIPYRDFVYTYPPLFLYVLYPFFYLGGINFAVTPILLADGLTSPLIYLLVRKTASEKIAIASGLGYALCPIVLFTEGYLWLSSQPMTFFLILSFYFLRKDRLWLSQITLGISALFKQEAIFVFPIYALYYAKKYHSHVLNGIKISTLVVILVSAPFLLIAPWQYVASVAYDLIRYVLPPTGSSSAAVLGSNTLLTNASLLSVTYSGYNPNPLVLGSVLFGFASIYAAIPLFVILSCYVILFVNIENFEILSAYSLIALLLIFWIIFQQAFMYYFVPVYALLFASSRTKLTVSAAIAVPALALLLPEGPAQLVISMLGMFVLLSIGSKSPSNLGQRIFCKLHGFFQYSQEQNVLDYLENRRV